MTEVGCVLADIRESELRIGGLVKVVPLDRP